MSARNAEDRSVLPIPDRPYDGPALLDAKDPVATFPPIQQLRPPDGAPNVLVILLDDVGFAASSAFGGPCATPTAERLAGQGLKYNRFHTTALCAPTRQALLTGRNHHTVGMGVITELATSAPGYNSIRPNTCAPLAQTLVLNGYSTAQFGKCHEVPVWQSSPMGPFDAWSRPVASWYRPMRSHSWLCPEYLHGKGRPLRVIEGVTSLAPQREGRVPRSRGRAGLVSTLHLETRARVVAR